MFARYVEWLRQKSKSSRFKWAVVLAALALVILIGVVQAGGPMNQYHPLRGGGQMGWGWGMYKWRWWPPAQPVPTMKIVAVVEDTSWTFTAQNLPEDEDFEVLVGPIYSRGVNGTEVGSFNSSDGVTERIYRIPPEFHGDERIAVRIQTDHAKPYYAFNWFWNNTTETNNDVSSTTEVEETAASDAGTGGAAEVASPMEVAAADTVEALFVNDNGYDPFSFEICAVWQDDRVVILTDNFPTDEEFFVQMGVMPYYPEAEPYYDGKMKKPPMGGGMPRMGSGEMGAGYNMLWKEYDQHGRPLGDNPMGGEPGYGNPMGGGPDSGGPMGSGPNNGGPMSGGPDNSGPMGGGPDNSGPMGGGPNNGGPMGGDPGYGEPMGGKPGYSKPGYPMPPMPPDTVKPQSPPWYWIPYYDVDSFTLTDGGEEYLGWNIPEELYGAYRISILIRTGHDYPYYAYNWFYNNDAIVCERMP